MQEIITMLIVTSAFGFGIYSLIKVIFPKNTHSQTGGCSSGCNCDAVKVRKELLINKTNRKNLKY